MFFFISTIFFLSSFFFFTARRNRRHKKLKKTKTKIFINFFFLLFMSFRFFFSCWQEKKSGKMRVWLTFPFCSSSGSCVSKKLLTIYDFFFSLKEEEDGEDTVIRVFKAFPSASGLESPNEKKKNNPFRVTLLFFLFYSFCETNVFTFF